MSSFKSSENIQKRERGPDRSVSDKRQVFLSGQNCKGLIRIHVIDLPYAYEFCVVMVFC